jgi:hypothetical protein
VYTTIDGQSRNAYRESRKRVGDADVRPRLEENGLDAFHPIGFEQVLRWFAGMD